MKIRKIFPMLFLAVLLVSPAWAGNFAEYDAAFQDNLNYFALRNVGYQLVNEYRAANYVDGIGDLEALSDFSAIVLDVDKTKMEGFHSYIDRLRSDPCWEGLQSVLTEIARGNTYWWKITLQMRPESDIDLNIYDCVLKDQGTTVFGDADQTGRWRVGPYFFFNPCASPAITVQAYPGPNASASFKSAGWQYLEARKMPSLHRTCLKEKWFTSKAMWDEGIVIAMPQTGFFNERGESNFSLSEGDVIKVTIEVPEALNTVDIRYGADNVILKYVGLDGTELLSSDL